MTQPVPKIKDLPEDIQESMQQCNYNDDDLQIMWTLLDAVTNHFYRFGLEETLESIKRLLDSLAIKEYIKKKAN